MQSELPLFPEPKPANASQELNVLLRFLRGKAEWTPGAVIEEKFGFSKRKRGLLVAESEHFIISGPGTPGYKHLLDCTPEDIQLASRKKLSQGKKMIRDAIGQQRAYHKAIHQS